MIKTVILLCAMIATMECADTCPEAKSGTGMKGIEKCLTELDKILAKVCSDKKNPPDPAKLTKEKACLDKHLMPCVKKWGVTDLTTCMSKDNPGANMYNVANCCNQAAHTKVTKCLDSKVQANMAKLNKVLQDHVNTVEKQCMAFLKCSQDVHKG